MHTKKIQFKGPWVIQKISSQHSPYFTCENFEDLKLVIELAKAEKKFKAIILEGADRYFSAGASKRSLLKAHPVSEIHHIQQVPPLLMSAPIPTIAVMKGSAIGEGFVLGLLCDMPLLAEDSLYGVNFMALGLTQGMGSTFILEEALGALMSRRLLLTGTFLKGCEFKKAGGPLSATILPKKEIRSEVAKILSALQEIPREVLEMVKGQMREKRGALLHNALKAERLMQRQLSPSHSPMPSSRLSIQDFQRALEQGNEHDLGATRGGKFD